VRIMSHCVLCLEKLAVGHIHLESQMKATATASGKQKLGCDNLQYELRMIICLALCLR